MQEGFKISNPGTEPVFSKFSVLSPSGRTYEVKIRSLKRRVNSCTCPDYQTNLLGTCKHIEAVLALIEKKLRGKIDNAELSAPPTAEVFLNYGEQVEVMLYRPAKINENVSELLSRYFDDNGTLLGNPIQQLPALLEDAASLKPDEASALNISPNVRTHADLLAVSLKHQLQRQWFLNEVKAGRRSLDIIGTKLYPYQVEGLLHLVFTGRALLADDMGLGKTVQAIGAAVLLKELRGISRVLVVTPASLKHQWYREIKKFTSLSAEVVQGPASKRELLYSTPSFFTLVNYELLLRDQQVYERLAPDLIILDEAQRVKNWRTKTAQAVKQLRSRYTFVLTGTPIENNLDELYSVLQTLDARLLGPLWQFNSRYYQLERRPSGSYKILGYKNLEELRKRIVRVVLRRMRDEVLHDLPPRVDNNFFVPMTQAQLEPYKDYQAIVARLLGIAHKRPLTPAESKRLMMALQKMRILCDALELHDRNLTEKQKKQTAPKLEELVSIVQEQVVAAKRKAVIFSSFEGMIDLAIDRVARPLKIGYVKLAGTVPTTKRGALLDRFREDESCRIFFSTDAGGVGLNLQSASLVINIDIPWNPAVLEQRIGRAHRMGQKETVQVINLVAQGVIEERMLDTLAQKRQIFQAVFSALEGEDTLVFAKDRGLMARLRQMLADEESSPASAVEARANASGGASAVTSNSAGLSADTSTGVSIAGSAAGSANACANLVPEHGDVSENASTVMPSTDSDKVKLFAERLSSKLGSRLLLIRKADRQAARLMVVVDQDASGLSSVVDEIADRVQGQNPLFKVHLFDKKSYESLQALFGGNLDLQDSVHEAYRSPALPASADRADDGRLQTTKFVREKLSQTAERLRLVKLMTDGGFAAEATAPLKQALDATMDGLYKLAGKSVPGDRYSILEIERLLVKPGILAPEKSASIQWMQSLLNSQGSQTTTTLEKYLVERIFASIEQLCESADLYLTARLL
ncbi:MAG: DEAD/DEAH box helicase [Candidatus Riflebacteria bacterium]|nr:DEAD/DEAH box helicase [Candidatus Riflebacteria bacterium]